MNTQNDGFIYPLTTAGKYHKCLMEIRTQERINTRTFLNFY